MGWAYSSGETLNVLNVHEEPVYLRWGKLNLKKMCS